MAYLQSYEVSGIEGLRQCKSGVWRQRFAEEVYQRGRATWNDGLFAPSEGNAGIWSAAQTFLALRCSTGALTIVLIGRPRLAPTSSAAHLDNSVHWMLSASSHDELDHRRNPTYKGRLRRTRGFFGDDTSAGLIRLLDLIHNWARSDGADWLHLAAADLWPQPIQLHHNTAPPPALPTPPSKPPPHNSLHN